MINIIKLYEEYCGKHGVGFQIENSVLSYDNTTLFCPAGMQQFKSKFKDQSYQNTIANIQPCIRLNDISELGDGTHLAYFNMIGLFSFRQWSINKTFKFWLDFILDLGFKKEDLTIDCHEDKYTDWSIMYDGLVSRVNNDCKWSDGEIGGYCTEFYYKDIEIGNIVNPLGNCIDVGFGLERLDQIVNNKKPPTKLESLESVINILISNGIKPSNKNHGYVLRRLLRSFVKEGGEMKYNQYYNEEVVRQQKLLESYCKLKDKHQDKTKEWWFDTHGIDLKLI